MNKYIRKESYGLEILPSLITDIPAERNRINLDGDLIRNNSKRYLLFNNSIECVKCGCKGSFLAKERARHDKKSRSYHLNMYAIVDGEEVLMTKNIIVPKSKGGKKHYSNYQVMCETCNNEKIREIVEEKKNVRNHNKD